MKLPTWDEASEKKDLNLEMTPADTFVYEYEVASPADNEWRHHLQALMDQVAREAYPQTLRTSVIAQCREHIGRGDDCGRLARAVIQLFKDAP
jgi:hypothetical protein